MPGLMQAWPTVAACWSPAMPSTGTGAPRMSAVATPNSPAQSTTLGSIDCGTPSSFAELGIPGALADVEQQACGWHWSRRSHGPCRRSGATAGSSRSCRRPARPSRPRRARPRRSSGSRRSWCRRNRDRAAGRSSPRPSSRGRRVFSSAHIGEVRRSCQTMALCTGLPVARSHTTVVSRWLVMPMPASSLASSLALASAPRQTSTVARQISSGSCSTQPGLGKICGSSFCAEATGRPDASNTIARVLVVPWSMARICLRRP